MTTGRSKKTATTAAKPRRAGSRALAVTAKAPLSEDELYERVADILESARAQVARTVNTSMVDAYWRVGREIVEVEQHGHARASYGEEVIARLAKRLTRRFGKGFSAQNLRRMRQFFLVFPAGSTIRSGLLSKLGEAPEQIRSGSLSKSSARPRFPASIGWTHYLVLLRITNPAARAFYELEATRERWTVPQLERQITALLFERLTKYRNPDEVRALARDGQHVATPADVIKDPFVLEFLDVREHPAMLERDIEQAIIDRLEIFLLEMGKGFCFVGRQVRMTIDGDHFYVDLVFYNRLLRCFVLVDLKLGRLTHQDLGQMLMYVNYYDQFQCAEHEAKTVGIVLCSEKNDAMVKITFPDNDQVLAATYKRYFPSEAELAAEITRERDEAERLLRLAAPAEDSDE